MGLYRSHRLETIAPLLIGLGIEALVALAYLSLPVTGNDVVPPNPEFLQWTHLLSWYIVVGLAHLVPAFFDDNTGAAILLLFGLQATFYAAVVYGLTRCFIKKRVSSL